ncbi:SpaA isopeptide-forming pilin-related protein [Streptomyces acidiscabies]|uniref:SpaA isopeptide-forming pilin-related protein n=1 Tax=Streptomyces acidiscabies TaxID=42234 RepID=A0AAP6BIZ8_9ACTN|nr:SpaA isopeptide-forming pilin-related protein [Streptomyces acidiscabies]MBP5935393.1 hypothetical protein [Streptomyces sp. LBUM 1476]MBZ3916758.1 hypothetical protein [Streptomyces acidiscabies]MDX2965604.1 SpaA isopeptide-forming pilin-related protein [Streptomyces acidiscabies]MDX3024894.1 SpaA isopeptide-forming pilin-related protein [Streptomyces acidiscabies]MDX3795520.1 SpaA isopeptide-forming pilin-related protein [Streptomyces acidiscabies]
MYARFVRFAAVAAVVTASLAWAPAASAQTPGPAPSASAAEETPAPETGNVELTTTDTAGDALPGATFLLLGSAGQEAGQAQTDAHGEAVFSGLTTGVYRLKETSTGSPLHEAAADQDVIATPGATTRLTVTDAFKAAMVLVRAKDSETGKYLSGATVNIATGSSARLTLTTGADGTASGQLPMTSRKTELRIDETRAPAGYGLDKQTMTVAAVPGSTATVTLMHTKTAAGPTNDPTPTPVPAATGSADTTPSSAGAAGPAPQNGTGTPDAASPSAAGTALADDTTPTAPTGSLAHTGADATAWLVSGAGALIAIGGCALLAARHRRTDNFPANDSSTS